MAWARPTLQRRRRVCSGLWLFVLGCLLLAGCAERSSCNGPTITFDRPLPYPIVKECFDGVPTWFVAEDQAWLMSRKLAPEEVGRFVAHGAVCYQPAVDVLLEESLTRLGGMPGNGYLYRLEGASGYCEVILFEADTEAGAYLVMLSAQFENAEATRAFVQFCRQHLVLQVD